MFDAATVAIIVDGATWHNASNLYAGDRATGALTIADGGEVDSDYAYISNQVGVVGVGEAGLAIVDGLDVGTDGAALLTVVPTRNTRVLAVGIAQICRQMNAFARRRVGSRVGRQQTAAVVLTPP